MGFTNHIYAQDWNQIYKSIPEDVSAGDYYGRSVDVDGDYAVIGASGYSSSSGRAYVLYDNGSAWETVASLSVSDGESNDNFGISVSISGHNIVIGAYGDDSFLGSGYVFTMPADGWVDMTETAILTSSDRAFFDFFGNSVSISGDNIVIGAYGDDSFSGSAYVFTMPSGGWVNMTETAILTSSDIALDDYFGYCVSISDDNIIIGARYNDDNDGSNRGSAYVYAMPSGGWVNMIETAKLTASDSKSDDLFGNSVAILGDNIVVGASDKCNDGSIYQSGSTYVFTKPATGWMDMTQTVKIVPPDLSGHDFSGLSVDISDNIIVIGAYGDNDIASDAGCAYVYKKPSSGNWTGTLSVEKITASDGNAFDCFGLRVCVSGDDILVGATYDDDNGSESGSAYAYTCKTVVSSIVRNHPESKIVEGVNQLVFRSTFSTEVDNVDATDFLINSTATCAITDVTEVSESIYDVTVFGADLTSFNGTLGLNVNPSSDIIDENNDLLYTSEPVSDEVYIVDNTAPIVGLSTTATSPVSGDFDVSITFSEEVSGFEAFDLTIVNGSVNGALVSSDNITYTVTVTPTTDGDVRISLAASVAQDLGGNDNEAAQDLILTSNVSTAIDDVQEVVDIEIHPNPASDKFTINVNNVEGGIVDIYSLSGQLVMTCTLQQGEETIDIGQLENGVYLLHIKTSTRTVTRKLVVKKIVF